MNILTETLCLGMEKIESDVASSSANSIIENENEDNTPEGTQRSVSQDASTD